MDVVSDGAPKEVSVGMRLLYVVACAIEQVAIEVSIYVDYVFPRGEPGHRDGSRERIGTRLSWAQK